MRKEFEHFNEYVNCETVERLHTEVLSDIDETRKAIMRFHRTSVVIPILDNPKDYAPWICSGDDLPHFILRPQEAIPPKVAPRFLQQTAHLFEFVHSNLSRLLFGLMSKIEPSLFKYAVDSAIPSLFGFFCSQEHETLALAFYIQIVNEVQADIGFRIVRPFLSCPGMFNFIESSLRPFFDRLRRDGRIKVKMTTKDRERMTHMYADDLMKLFGTNKYLLPRSVRVIVTLMQQQWGTSIAANMLVHDLLKTLSTRFMDSAGYSKKNVFLKDVFEYIDEQACKQLLDAIADCPSRFAIPELYACFGHAYLTFYTCTADCEVLALLMEKKQKLPPSVASLTAETKGRQAPANSMFWTKVFPKRAFPPMKLPQPLFFETRSDRPEPARPEYARTWMMIRSKYPNDSLEFVDCESAYDSEFREYCLAMCVADLHAGAKVFEDVFLFKHWLAHIVEWKAISEEHTRMMIMPVADLACKKVGKRHERIEVAFELASNLFGSRLIMQDQFLSLVDMYLPDLFGKRQTEFDELCIMWSSLVTREAERLEQMTSFSSGKSANALYWESIEGLGNSEDEPLRYGFRILMRSFKLLGMLCRYGTSEKDLLREAILIAKSERAFSVYVAAKLFVMENKLFTQLCTVEENSLWVRCEHVILTMIMNDSMLSSRFFQLLQDVRRS